MRIPKVHGAIIRAKRFQADARMRRQIRVVEEHLRGARPERRDGKGPVLFFNASTRIHLPSLNTAFSLLASWAVRADGVPARYVVCHRGMDLCILGTKREDYGAAPPCGPCLGRSSDLFPPQMVVPVEFDPAEGQRVREELEGRTIDELTGWSRDGLPLGELCLPGLRWALRRHRITDDRETRGLFRRYLASAVSLARRFGEVFEKLEPRALVVFNGIMYPEAVARAVAVRKGIPVVTHEVGLRPFSAFFSHGHATFREVEISTGYELSVDEEKRLDEYLEARFRGKFTMAGIRFWPEMKKAPEELLRRMSEHRQTVAVFTNVIFDTSQVHANTIFPDMFSWLDAIAVEIEADPQTLFVIRAHPDEERPGKTSRETVEDWLQGRGLSGRSNVVFFGPKDPVSSYELIRRSEMILVYNSSIGLEASILGVPVLCAGRARYTQIPTVFFQRDREAYAGELHRMLREGAIKVPPEFASNARRFLSYELYQASLDLSEFLLPYPGTPGMAEFSEFSPEAIGRDEELAVIRDGILAGRPFVMGESSRVPSGASGGRQ